MPGGPLPPNIGNRRGHPSRPVELLVVRNAAARWRISPKTLWGVYGTETDYGENIAVSSAGAKGPFQFMDATARQYKVDVRDFTSSAFGAAHYLHDLGADTNPNSTATTKALNAYNGNGGGEAVTEYVKSVRDKGGSMGHNNPISGAVGAVGDVVGGAVDTATAVPKFLGKLGGVIFSPNFWLRVGLILGGIVALAVGLVFIGKDFTPVGAVTKAIGKR